MVNTYTILPLHLYETGDSAITWFIDNWGLNRSNLKIEEPVHADAELRPTFRIVTTDYYILCIEVSEIVYAKHLDAFVLSCERLGLPVKLFVAIPKGTKYQDYSLHLKSAKRAGVGVIEVNATSGEIIQDALSLTLNAVRRIDVSKFPKKYRLNLSQAEQKYREGDPVKACSRIYDEIEGLFRKIAAKSAKNGWWPKPKRMSIQKCPWSTLVEDWNKNIDRKLCPHKGLSAPLGARIHGITPYRNETGHKITSQAALIKRDLQLRTRFESATDLFHELVEASKPLHL